METHDAPIAVDGNLTKEFDKSLFFYGIKRGVSDLAELACNAKQNHNLMALLKPSGTMIPQ